MNIFFSLLISFVVVVARDTLYQKLSGSENLSKWMCVTDGTNKCVPSRSPEDSRATTLHTCKMLCPRTPPIWPRPKTINILNKTSSTFTREHISLSIHCPESIRQQLEEAANLFLAHSVPGENNFYLHAGQEDSLRLALHVQHPDYQLTTGTTEHYVLYSQKFSNEILVNVYADNYFGARHGLETLGQLIWYDTAVNKFRIIHDVQIIDEPKFAHRGLLIDVARHFMPISFLEKAIDGMAASKLNVLHLHLSDIESFPLELPRNDRFALNGAYGENMTYKVKDMKNLVEFAKKRGIKIIMEIDAPSHVTPEAWPEDEVLCREPDPFHATLNPDNPESLNDLQSIYQDLLDLGSDPESFHIGNDEVSVNCWQATRSAKEANFDFYKLWANFTNRMMDRVRLANNGTMPAHLILWSSPLTDQAIQLLEHRENVVIQYWFGQYAHLLAQGYKIIFSTVGQWYLDCGFGPWKKGQQLGSCDPYTDWRRFYKYRPWNVNLENLDRVLGGEACLWTEQVDPEDLETRLWPRAAAFAERMWHDPVDFERDDVFFRLDWHSDRLRRRGLRVAAMWAQICSIYPERC